MTPIRAHGLGWMLEFNPFRHELRLDLRGKRCTGCPKHVWQDAGLLNACSVLTGIFRGKTKDEMGYLVDVLRLCMDDWPELCEECSVKAVTKEAM